MPSPSDVIKNFGMGWDSTAILLRWFEEPECRDFELSDLTLVMAQVGDEFPDTKLLVENYIFPLLREHNIRTVQVARAGPSDKDGITVLSDTRQPYTLHTEGVWKLSEHLMRDGTAPQFVNGRHFCAVRFKAWPIGQWITSDRGTMPYRSVIGYNADEDRRATKANEYADLQRAHEYPLIQWGWGRPEVEAYVRLITGVEWARSHCPYCPFANGRKTLVERHRNFPLQGSTALLMELKSRSLNPRFGLFPSGVPLVETLRKAGVTEPIRIYEEQLATMPWALYRVQRIYREKPPLVDRNLRIVSEGSREAMVASLREIGQTETEEKVERVYLRHREGKARPAVEEFYVAAPGGIQEKSKKSFAVRWKAYTQHQPVAVPLPPRPAPLKVQYESLGLAA